MIKMLITDIDGVLTDGKVYITNDGKSSKSLCFKDLDALSQLKKNGVKLAIITGEKNEFTDYVRESFSPNYFFDNCKNKENAILQILKKTGYKKSEICYVGDGKYDISSIKLAEIGMCPCDAIGDALKVADVVLDKKAGEGCLSEVFSYIVRKNSQEDVFNMPHENDLTEIDTILFEHQTVLEEIRKDYILIHNIKYVISELVKSIRSGNKILLCGNGGSAADAQHIATEFVSKFNFERSAIDAEALNVNTSSITAIGNDYNFNYIFSRQVEAKGKVGDVLVGLSTSGLSKNVIEALKMAKKRNMLTVALIGNNSNMMDGLVDYVLAVPSSSTPRIQEMHITIGHIICQSVERKLFKE